MRTTTPVRPFLAPGRSLLAFALMAGIALATPGRADAGISRPDDRIDPATGRDRANWPHPRHFDFLNLRLEVDIPDIGTPTFNGRATYTMTPIGRDRTTLVLDARTVDAAGNGIEISGVRINGRRAEFVHDDSVLTITLPKPATLGKPVEAVIDYVCTFPSNGGNGLTWSAKGEDPECPTDQVPQIHSQGQPESNRRWIPAHDFPNERLATEMVVTVKTGFEVLSNGALIEQTDLRDGRTRWHWKQTKPHPTYLIMLAVGDFETRELGSPDGSTPSDRPGLRMMLYGPKRYFEPTVPVFKDTPAMMAFYEAYFDEPYPWDKYDQVICRDFKWGGMENTSATVIYPAAVGSEPGSQDDLIAHELIHQWTGDLITCKSWEHLWLNEGWASFGEALWQEYKAVLNLRRAGGGAPIPTPQTVLTSALTPEERQAARRAYQRRMFQFLGPQRALNRGYAPVAPPMASNRYADPEQPFTKGDDVYGKGALVIHMLRVRLGDEVFLKAVREYVDRFKFNEVETDDFRKVLEEVSGQSLERFFDQWVRRPGLPRLEVDLSWDNATNALNVSAEQIQRVDADNPAYALVIPLYVKFADGSWQYVYLDTDVKSVNKSFPLPSKPASVSIDPNLTIAGAIRTRTPLAMLWNGLLDAPSVIARARAADELANRVLAAGEAMATGRYPIADARSR